MRVKCRIWPGVLALLLVAGPALAEQHGDGYGPRQDDEREYGGGQGQYVVGPALIAPYAVAPAYPYSPGYAPAYPYTPSYAYPPAYAPPAAYVPAEPYAPAPPYPQTSAPGWGRLPPLRPPPYDGPAYGYPP